MGNPISNVEEFFLKIFKITVLVIMTLCLIGTLLGILYSVQQFSQSPKEAAPARKAPERDPVKEINIDQLKNFLIEQEKRKNAVEPELEREAENRQSVQYLEDATKLYRCSGDFAEKIGAKIESTSDTEDVRRINDLRRSLEEAASNKFRGEPWVKAAVSFTCMALSNDSIIQLKKEGKVGSVFYPILNFHTDAWDTIQNEKIQFERDEEYRVASERDAEESRVAKAKARAITSLAVAGSSFGLFMMLALYLLFSKIESDLSNINSSIRILESGKAASEKNSQ